MLHIPLSLVSLGFPPMDENLHDTVDMAVVIRTTLLGEAVLIDGKGYIYILSLNL